MSRLLPVSCFAAVLSACFSPTFEAPATNEEPGTVSEEARVCSVGAVCTADSDCCLGHFCDSSPYGSSVCSAGRANGSYCTANSQCRSQVCQGFGCVAIACASAGSDCSDTGCCAGSFCDFFGYGPTTCRPTRAA